MKKSFNKKETGEDATKYGEFVSSYFGWITPKQQKEKAEKLEKIGRKKKIKWEKMRKRKRISYEAQKKNKKCSKINVEK